MAPKIVKKAVPETTDAPKESDHSTEKIIDDLIDDDEEEVPKGSRKTLSEVRAAINKKYGSGTMIVLKDKPDFVRIPTGVHGVDYITGGGIPVGQSSAYAGGFSGGKTTLALNTVASFQNICHRCYLPLRYCLCSTPSTVQDVSWLNIEGTIDPVWAKTVGADIEKVELIEAGNGEEYTDIGMELLRVESLGLMVVDSIGSLMALAEMDNSAESSNMGISARLITKLTKKFKQATVDEGRDGHRVTILYINQKRTDLKVTYGSNETTPGGEAWKHDMSILLRCAKQSLTDADKAYQASKSSGDRNTATRHAVSITKAKVYTLGASAYYTRSVDASHKEWGPAHGKVMDYGALVKKAVASGVLGDDPKNLNFMDTKFKTQKELILHIFNDFQAKLMLSHLIIEADKKERMGK